MFGWIDMQVLLNGCFLVQAQATPVTVAVGHNTSPSGCLAYSRRLTIFKSGFVITRLALPLLLKGT